MEVVQDTTKCDYCYREAEVRVELMRLFRANGRWAKVWSGQYLYACSEHMPKAIEQAEAGIRR